MPCLISRSTELFKVIIMFCKCVYLDSQTAQIKSDVQYDYGNLEINDTRSISETTLSTPMDSDSVDLVNAEEYTIDDSSAPSEFDHYEILTEKVPFETVLLGTENQVCNGVRNPINGSDDLLMNYFNNFVKAFHELKEKVVHNESMGLELYKILAKRKGPRFLRAKFNMSILNKIYEWNSSTQILFINLFNETKAGWANLTKYVSEHLIV